MVSVSNFNFWILLSSISQVSAVSYNQPKFSSNASWNPNATTFANSSTIGLSPYDIFINTNNTIYIPNPANGQIMIWFEGNGTITSNSFGNLSNPYSIFVTTSDDIYVDTFNSIGGVSKWTSNATIGVLTMVTCQKCWDLFVDINDTLYCSLSGRHQVITKSSNNGLNILMIVAGTGSADSASNTLSNPRGIFVDINFDLYVADCGNNRIQLFHFGKLSGTTVAGSGSLNTTITLNCPTGIILDADNYLFIVDSGNHRIVALGSNGFRCLLGCSGSNGSASNQLNGPWSISFDSYGNIFVTDQGNNRIQKFILSTNSNATVLILLSECSNYTTITDATRNVAYTGSSVCDNMYFNSTVMWVRFSGAAGTQMPTNVVAISHCRTDAPGYYTGVMPSVWVTVTGTVCYNWAGNICNWNNSISVTNCNGYYVYELIAPPHCFLRYCTV